MFRLIIFFVCFFFLFNNLCNYYRVGYKEGGGSSYPVNFFLFSLFFVFENYKRECVILKILLKKNRLSNCLDLLKIIFECQLIRTNNFPLCYFLSICSLFTTNPDKALFQAKTNFLLLCILCRLRRKMTKQIYSRKKLVFVFLEHLTKMSRSTLERLKSARKKLQVRTKTSKQKEFRQLEFQITGMKVRQREKFILLIKAKQDELTKHRETVFK